MTLRIYKYAIPIGNFYQDNEPPALLRDVNIPDNAVFISHSMAIHDDDVLVTILFREEE